MNKHTRNIFEYHTVQPVDIFLRTTDYQLSVHKLNESIIVDLFLSAIKFISPLCAVCACVRLRLGHLQK